VGSGVSDSIVEFTFMIENEETKYFRGTDKNVIRVWEIP
jgi:hypothetical protein